MIFCDMWILYKIKILVSSSTIYHLSILGKLGNVSDLCFSLQLMINR